MRLEKEYEEIAKKAASKSFNDSSKFNTRTYDKVSNSMRYGYDHYLVEVLDFEFVSIDYVY